jgi:hypothetical protein
LQPCLDVGHKVVQGYPVTFALILGTGGLGSQDAEVPFAAVDFLRGKDGGCF